VLRNKLNIRDPRALERAESHLTAMRIAELQMQRNYEYGHLVNGEGAMTPASLKPCCPHPINRHAAKRMGIAFGGELAGCGACDCPNGRTEAAATRPPRVVKATDANRDLLTIVSLEMREIGQAMGFGPSKAKYFAREMLRRIDAAGFTVERRRKRPEGRRTTV
jgi:hypothetical protein